MPQPPKPPASPRAPSLDEPYEAGDPIPTPEASERSSDTVWSLWKDVVSKESARFADTVPVTVPGASSPKLPAAGAVGMRETAAAVTFDDCLNEARRNNRVCPQPGKWLELYQLLADKPDGASIPPPLIGPAWNATPALAKRMCFRDHLEWADAHGCSEEVFAFMASLPEPNWYHMGE